MNAVGAHAAWLHPRLAAQVVRPRRDGRAETVLRIEGLADARQVLRLDERLHALPGVSRVAIDARAQRARIVWDPARLALPQLLDAFAAAGCSARPLRRDQIDDARSGEATDALKRLLVAGMCAMQVMTYAFVMYIGVVDFVDFTTRGLFRWLSLLTTAPVIAYSAQPFLAGAWRELRMRRLGVNLTVSLAIVLTFGASVWSTVRGHGEIYFDSVSMFVFLLLAARHVELRARHASGALGEAAQDATPLLAERRRADGSLETVPALELLAGDRVRIAEGGTVPADGVLESASIEVDEALLSGESHPRRRERGERLVAGSVVLGGPADLRVEHSGDDTTAARLGRLAGRARQAREPVDAADRDASRFVLRVLVLTVLTALAWLYIDRTRAFDAAVAVLVVACPCAFALTRPAALTRALAVLAGRGVLVTEPAALDTLARVDYALFDKTGTLTTPWLEPDAVEPLREGLAPTDALRLAAALARESTHPLAAALAAAWTGDTPPVESLVITATAGISAEVDGHALRLGRPDFALAPSGRAVPASAAGTLLLADIHGPLAAFHVSEAPRADAAATLQALRREGIVTALASGDTRARVATVASALGITRWAGRQSPADKLALLEVARTQGHVTLAIGDGSNDAPALAGADVSAALASGTDLAQAHAGVLLARGRLDGLLQARRIARELARVVAQGRRWSLAYNLLAVPFAAAGLVPPWLAAIGMSASSLVVVLNGLRVGRGHAAPALRA
ncbi:heavy metal translocating P-type ATPase [Frateuria hangzhouensis]|uniref:heavy metal translocating P-type ATPase n=1 Tax=Frateuria hangzhouensis TaxID=2995589 RepID=UPI0022609D7F|nr:heavy metal translocating P-type ATPase [Frateuria sp. STR12]MCX7515031.1 heavy metal translocating P-type ATPase [Frateuria sp. STR12]